MLGASLMGLALLVALVGARGLDRRTYVTNVVAVGFGWYLAMALMPYGG